MKTLIDYELLSEENMAGRYGSDNEGGDRACGRPGRFAVVENTLH